MNDQDLLTVRQVADLLQVDRRTVQRWIESGMLPAYRVGPVLLRVSARALEAFLRDGGRVDGS